MLTQVGQRAHLRAQIKLSLTTSGVETALTLYRVSINELESGFSSSKKTG